MLSIAWAHVTVICPAGVGVGAGVGLLPPPPGLGDGELPPVLLPDVIIDVFCMLLLQSKMVVATARMTTKVKKFGRFKPISLLWLIDANRVLPYTSLVSR